MTKSRFYPFTRPSVPDYSRYLALSFDVDFPVDCDDEYWTPSDGGVPFKQPPGVPSKITFFNLSNRLNQITSLVLRTIVSSQYATRIELMRDKKKYSINRSKALLGYVGPQWQQAIVARLDSALNNWVDSIPDHRKQFSANTTTGSSSSFSALGSL